MRQGRLTGLHLVVVEYDPLAGVFLVPNVTDVVARVVGGTHVRDERSQLVPSSHYQLNFNAGYLFKSLCWPF